MENGRRCGCYSPFKASIILSESQCILPLARFQASITPSAPQRILPLVRYQSRTIILIPIEQHSDQGLSPSLLLSHLISRRTFRRFSRWCDFLRRCHWWGHLLRCLSWSWRGWDRSLVCGLRLTVVFKGSCWFSLFLSLFCSFTDIAVINVVIVSSR